MLSLLVTYGDLKILQEVIFSLFLVSLFFFGNFVSSRILKKIPLNCDVRLFWWVSRLRLFATRFFFADFVYLEARANFCGKHLRRIQR